MHEVQNINTMGKKYTVVWEKFGVKNFCRKSGVTKIKRTKFSYQKEIVPFIMVCGLLGENYLLQIFLHEYFQPLIFPKLQVH